jgi:hypothetical protein
MGIISPGFPEYASTVNKISMVDPFKVYSLFVNSEFPERGGAMYGSPILSFPQAVYLMLPWAIIPLIIGVIMWHRKF